MIGYCQPYPNGTHSLHFTYDEAFEYAKTQIPMGQIGPFKCLLSREESLSIQKNGHIIQKGIPPKQKIAMGCKPDPFKFTVKHFEIVNNNTIIIANYGGQTFNGNKLMVLRGFFDINELISLDPHFLDEEYVVVARFVPTEEGLKLARLCAENIKHK